MWSIEHNVGKLVEIRIKSPVTTEEVAAFWLRFAQTISRIPGRYVLCTNLVEADIFPPDVAEGFLEGMRRHSKRLIRNGFLVGSTAMFALQIERLIRQSQSPNRRTFHSPEPLLTWLSEVLNPLELESARRRVGG